MADERLLDAAGDLLWAIASEVVSKRLPAKSDIGRCRLVSRAWRSVMSTGKFHREYRNNHPVTIDEYKLAVVDVDGEGFHTFSLGDEIPSPPPSRLRSLSLSPKVKVSLSFLASLDGLLVIAEQKRGAYATLLIYNPTTPLAMELPRLHGLYFFSKEDPLGFYFDAAADDYKLVRLSRYAGESHYGAFLYSFRSGSWTPLGFDNHKLLDRPGETLFDWSPPISWGQHLYFEASFVSKDNWKGRSRIICFDVKTREFSQTPFPHFQDDDACFHATLALVDGRLRLYVSLHATDHLPVRVQVWKVKDDADDVEDAQNWVKVGSFEKPLPHYVCATYAGNSVAVLDEDENSFKKMDAKEFEARYPWPLPPTSEYGLSRVIYAPSFVDPCPASSDMCQDSQ